MENFIFGAVGQKWVNSVEKNCKKMPLIPSNKYKGLTKKPPVYEI